MTVFLKPGEDSEGKPIIRLQLPKSDRWADDKERRLFIRSVHFFFHRCEGSPEDIAYGCNVSVEEVEAALKCEP
jgi:hypothetical protein